MTNQTDTKLKLIPLTGSSHRRDSYLWFLVKLISSTFLPVCPRFCWSPIFSRVNLNHFPLKIKLPSRNLRLAFHIIDPMNLFINYVFSSLWLSEGERSVRGILLCKPVWYSGVWITLWVFWIRVCHSMCV